MVEHADTAKVLTFGDDEAEEDLDADDEDYVGEDEPDDGESLGSQDTPEPPKTKTAGSLVKQNETKIVKGRGGARAPEETLFKTPFGCVLALTPFFMLLREKKVYDAGRGVGNVMNTIKNISERLELDITVNGCDLYNGDEAFRGDVFEKIESGELQSFDCVIANPPFNRMSKWLPTLAELRKPLIVMMRCESLSSNFFRKAVGNYPFFFLTFPRFEFESNETYVPIEGLCWVFFHPYPEMLEVVKQMEPLGNNNMGFLQHPSVYENEISAEEIQRLKSELDDYSLARPVVQSLDGAELFNANKDT